MIKKTLRKATYFTFSLLSKFKTNFFSNFFVGAGYFIKSNAEFVQSTAVNYKNDRYKMHEYISSEYVGSGTKISYFEFGVKYGVLIFRWAKSNKNSESVFIGFDTFTGLPGDWGNIKKGAFSVDGQVPSTNDARVEFCVGLVQDTLKAAVKKIDLTGKLIVHLDFDLYDATLYTLIALQPYLKSGDILILDEYFSISKNHHEYRAFHDFLSLSKLKYSPVIKSRDGQYVIKVD